MNDLERRILDISYKYKLSHIGSCLTALPIINEIYKTRKPNEPFILSQGHAGLALYVVLEKYEGKDAEELWKKHGTHPNRDLTDGIYCSTGSLGHGLPIAVGMALSDKAKNVYCLISDGEAAEGSIWEALNIFQDEKVDNLKIFVNDNGYSAYRLTPKSIYEKLLFLDPLIDIRETNTDNMPFLRGLEGHYHVLTKEEYETYVR